MDNEDILQQADALIRRPRGGRGAPVLALDDSELEDDAPLLTEEVEDIIDLEIPQASSQKLKPGLMEGLVEQRVAELLPSRIEAGIAERMPSLLSAAVEAALPERIEAALESRLPDALAARLEAELPDRVRTALLEKLAGASSGFESLDQDIGQYLENAVAARLALLLPVKIEEALPERVNAALEQRMDATRENLRNRLKNLTQSWLEDHLPGIVADEMESFSTAVVKRARDEAQSSIAASVDDLIDTLVELNNNRR